MSKKINQDITLGTEAAGFIRSLFGDSGDAQQEKIESALTKKETRTLEKLTSEMESLIHDKLDVPSISGPLHNYMGAVVEGKLFAPPSPLKDNIKIRQELGKKIVNFAEIFARAASKAVSEDKLAQYLPAEAHGPKQSQEWIKSGAPTLARLALK